MIVLWLLAALSIANAYLPSNNISKNIKNVILFDGVCNFCNRWVDLLISVDKNKVFSFAALQSDRGKQILGLIGRRPDDISTVILVKNLEEVYFKSDVPIQVLKELSAPTYYLGTIMEAFPFSFRNRIYDIVAANRYNFLGKREECRCGTAGVNGERFQDDL